MKKLLLASASPRRKELLSQLGLQFDVASMDIDESVRAGEDAESYVRRLAEEKARAGIEHDDSCIVIAADTTVVMDNEIYGKPSSDQEAKNVLCAFSGRSHIVHTGVAVASKVKGNLKVESKVITTQVQFTPLTSEQIEWYISSGEHRGKAGSYAIQGRAAVFIESIKGSYTNVVGLPMRESAELIEAAGFTLWA